jgi:hypothetical protein
MSRYIDEDDLMRFMIKEEVDLVFPLLEGGETGRIDRKDLTDWVVRQFPFVLLKFLVRFAVFALSFESLRSYHAFSPRVLFLGH